MSSDPMQAPPAQPVAANQPLQVPIPFNIAEEFGTARKKLPPTKIVLIGVGILIVIAAVVAIVMRPLPGASGSIDNIVTVSMPGQSAVMVAIGLSVHNDGNKAYNIHEIKADLEAGGNFSDDPAAAVDFERYFQAFPALQKMARPPLLLDTKVQPGGSVQGTIIVSFPVTADTFANRKSLTVTIFPGDRPVPLILTK